MQRGSDGFDWKAKPIRCAGRFRHCVGISKARADHLSCSIVPRRLPPFDAWGNAGDALPLMKAVKQQLDPKNTLNPGRFVGGI